MYMQLIEDKKVSRPSPKEMASFAKQYTPTQWQILCKNSEFLKAFCENLTIAKKNAKKIISR